MKGETMLQRRQFIQASAAVVTALGLPSTAGAAGSKIIDAQVHCYERNRHERPRAGVLVGPDEITGDQMNRWPLAQHRLSTRDYPNLDARAAWKGVALRHDL
jgi:hypothetical protein